MLTLVQFESGRHGAVPLSRAAAIAGGQTPESLYSLSSVDLPASLLRHRRLWVRIDHRRHPASLEPHPRVHRHGVEMAPGVPEPCAMSLWRWTWKRLLTAAVSLSLAETQAGFRDTPKWTRRRNFVAPHLDPAKRSRFGLHLEFASPACPSSLIRARGEGVRIAVPQIT